MVPYVCSCDCFENVGCCPSGDWLRFRKRKNFRYEFNYSNHEFSCRDFEGCRDTCGGRVYIDGIIYDGWVSGSTFDSDHYCSVLIATCERLYPRGIIFVTSRSFDGKFGCHDLSCLIREKASSFGFVMFTDDLYYEGGNLVGIGSDIVKCLGFDPNSVFLFLFNSSQANDNWKNTFEAPSSEVRWRGLSALDRVGSFEFSLFNAHFLECVAFKLDQCCDDRSLEVFKNKNVCASSLSGCYRSGTNGCFGLPRFFFVDVCHDNYSERVYCGVPGVEDGRSFKLYGSSFLWFEYNLCKIHDVASALSATLPIELYNSDRQFGTSFKRYSEVCSHRDMAYFKILNDSFWKKFESGLFTQYFSDCMSITNYSQDLEFIHFKNGGGGLLKGDFKLFGDVDNIGRLLTWRQRCGWTYPSSSPVDGFVDFRYHEDDNDIIPLSDGMLSWSGTGDGLLHFHQLFPGDFDVGVFSTLRTGGHFVSRILDHSRLVGLASVGVFSYDFGWFKLEIARDSFDVDHSNHKGVGYCLTIGDDVISGVSTPLFDLEERCTDVGLTVCTDTNLLSYVWFDAKFKRCLLFESASKSSIASVACFVSLFRIIVLRQELATCGEIVSGHTYCGCDRCECDKILPVKIDGFSSVLGKMKEMHSLSMGFSDWKDFRYDYARKPVPYVMRVKLELKQSLRSVSSYGGDISTISPLGLKLRSLATGYGMRLDDDLT